jgi:hypothetical protein
MNVVNNTKGILSKYSKKANSIIDNIKILDRINNFPPIYLKNINSENLTIKKIEHKQHELKKYKVSLFLNRELQKEIEECNSIISTQLNNEILLRNYTYNEDKHNLILHKKSNEFYIIIHFHKLKPLFDQKRKDKEENDAIEKETKDHFDSDVFNKLAGIDNNLDLKNACKY